MFSDLLGREHADHSVYAEALNRGHVVLTINTGSQETAERAADIIRGKLLPAAEDAPILADEAWKSRQRGTEIARDYANDRDALRAQLLSEMTL